MADYNPRYLATVNRLMERYETERARLVTEYVTSAWRMWMSLSPADWWNDAITQGASANLTARYMAFVERMRRLGISYADTALGLVGATAEGQLPSFEVVRDNTDPWKMMVRPVETYRDLSSDEPHLRPTAWTGLDEYVQRSVDKWLDESRERLEDIIDTDSTIIGTRVTLDRYRSGGVERYRRIIHPELSRTGTCGLCVVAADRVYTIRELMPLHANCHCTVLPITSGNDPGLRLNDDDLKALYEKAGGNTGAKLRQTRVLTLTNGEIGPVLSAKDVKPRDDIPWHMPGSDMTKAQIERMLNRATAFNVHYRQVEASGKPDDFRYEEHNYHFKPSDKLKQALAANLAFARQLRARLSLAA
ncbi:hypothetical protein [Bifidobacterium myosotis]|uniref:Uncharacterized protein n=1 Tax=Bifidobacterium myosotis TaxID=1630166 RepID=A0A5M9ZK24_9BIFI|nr:hypothetical protein [Bifidobacterium myosotis]KAA8827242.1 hypothetical protein EMO91_09355 [Bifidobacterium myosotis]